MAKRCGARLIFDQSKLIHILNNLPHFQDSDTSPDHTAAQHLAFLKSLQLATQYHSGHEF